MVDHDPAPVEVTPGEIQVSDTGDVVIGAPTAIAIIVPTPEEE